MNPEEATRLAIAAIRHGCIHDKHQWVASALDSGDLRIVSSKRLVALEKVAETGSHERLLEDHCTCGPGDNCHETGEAQKAFEQALAELDALGKEYT